MSALRLLIVEDSEQDLRVCRDSATRYGDEKKCKIDLVECQSVDEAFQKLDKSFDGAIIDLKLDDQGDEGNQVLSRIKALHIRIPVAILTGTPDAVDSDFKYIGVFKKGDPGTEYANLFQLFQDIYNTGLTRIMDGCGLIENTLDKVFRETLILQKDIWVKYGQINPDKTEKALLRHTLSHLLQLLDTDAEQFFPEEVYLTTPNTQKIRTGSIIKNKDSDQMFVVMTPSCDLVIRDNDKCNTDRILIIEIDSQAAVFPDYPATGLSKNQRGELTKAYRNNKSAYYHWLPRTIFFPGGFLNFRKVLSLSHEEFKERFENLEIQISPYFIKDMVARFSAYYARQGQPDIDFKDCINPEAAQTEN